MTLGLDSLPREAHLAGRRQAAAHLLSFVLVGGFSAACYVLLSVWLVELPTGLPDWLMGAAAYALLIVPVYLAHRSFAFRTDTPHAVALPRYVAVQLNALLIATVFSYIGYAVLGLAPAVAACFVAGLTAAVNFMILKLWAFAPAA